MLLKNEILGSQGDVAGCIRCDAHYSNLLTINGEDRVRLDDLRHFGFLGHVDVACQDGKIDSLDVFD